MTYVVTHSVDYEGSTPVAAFKTLTSALDFAKEKAEAHALEVTRDYQLNCEATITRYHQQIAEHGPDHVPDDMMLSTESLSDPNPWYEKTLAERLRIIESRGPHQCKVTSLNERVGYRAGDESWEIAALEDRD